MEDKLKFIVNHYFDNLDKQEYADFGIDGLGSFIISFIPGFKVFSAI